VRRHRSGYKTSTPMVLREKRLQAVQHSSTRSTETPTVYFNPHGPTQGAIQGNNYQLKYYADGIRSFRHA